MKYYPLLFLLALFYRAFIQGDSLESAGKIKIRHVVPEVVHIEITLNQESRGGSGTPLALEASDLIQTKAFEVEEVIKLENLTTNVPVILKIKNLGWSLPPEYSLREEGKSLTGQDSQLLLQVSSIAFEKGILTADKRFHNAYQPVSDRAESVIYLGGRNEAGKQVGVVGGEVEMDAKIAFDPAYDVPGTYEVTLELLVAPNI